MLAGGLDLGTLLADGTAAVGHVVDVVALVQLLVEGLVLATADAARASLDADEVHLAVVLRGMEGVVRLLLAQQLGLGGRGRAAEAQEGLGVAVLDLVGPVALVGGRVPGQSSGQSNTKPRPAAQFMNWPQWLASPMR